MNRGILALDLSGSTGWAFGSPGEVPLTGTWELPRYALDAGRCLAALENELADAIMLHQPGAVWVEAPLPAKAARNQHDAMQQIQLDGAVRSTCYRWERLVRAENVMTVRKAILGRGNGLAKDAIVAWARGQGWTVHTHHAADAAVLWAYAHKAAVAS